MDGRSFIVSPLISEKEENDNSGPESPPRTILNDMNMTSISSPRRSKRGAHKRVVSVPIKDVEGIKLKGENSPPPSDSWAWRKYGQKPIKGSPYPRGYYRCSSSKGCPARKQVEKSKADPTMLVVTYSCEHNHPWPPASRTHHHKSAAAKPEIKSETPEEPEREPEPEAEDNKISTDLAADQESSRATTTNDDHELISWFGHEMETTSSVFQTTPIFAGSDVDDDVAMFFPMREEDESLFADLGELPECSSVFKYHRGAGPQAQIC